MVYKFCDKETQVSGITLANKSAIKSTPQNEKLADELDIPIIKKLKKVKYILPIKIMCRLQIQKICN